MREDDGPRPSARAAQRLAADIGAEVGDLRVALRRALDESDRLQAAGRHDLAADVLEDQRQALAVVHRHLTERLAAAAVEREADHVVGVAAGRPEPVVDTVPAGWDTSVLVRLAASAAAAVAGLTLLLAPDLGGGMLEMAGWGVDGHVAPIIDESGVPASPAPAVSTSPAAETNPDDSDEAGSPPRPVAATDGGASSPGGQPDASPPAGPPGREAVTRLLEVLPGDVVPGVSRRQDTAAGDGSDEDADRVLPSPTPVWDDIDDDRSDAE